MKLSKKRQPESRMRLEREVRAESRDLGVSQVEAMVTSQAEAKLCGLVWRPGKWPGAGAEGVAGPRKVH